MYKHVYTSCKTRLVVVLLFFVIFRGVSCTYGVTFCFCLRLAGRLRPDPMIMDRIQNDMIHFYRLLLVGTPSHLSLPYHFKGCQADVSGARRAEPRTGRRSARDVALQRHRRAPREPLERPDLRRPALPGQGARGGGAAGA